MNGFLAEKEMLTNAMCGISFCYLTGDSDTSRTVSRMAATLSHRGPDATHTFVNEVADGRLVGMGHNRLSVIDLSVEAAQPMKSEDGRYVLIYNGEVYNYREIAIELGRGDLVSGGAGDTAVVLAALIKWGSEALPRFNGMWALVLYDIQNKTILVSRDRFGKKPLYYFQRGTSFFIASEIKAIIAGTGSRFRINPQVAVPFLTRGLVDTSEETLFDGVKQFSAGSFEFVQLGGPAVVGLDMRRFWHHPVERGITAVKGGVSPLEIRDLLFDSVKLRLRSDVPIGVLLSGGLDSSSILAAVAAARSLGDVMVLSVISDDPGSSEEPFIDAMVDFVGCGVHKFNASTDPNALLDSLSDACWYNDGPISSLSSLAHLNLVRIARRSGVKVLLTGQGADEQLGGYNKFFYFYLLELLYRRKYATVLKTLAQFGKNSDTISEFRLSEAARYIGKRRLARRSFIAPRHHDADTLQIGYNGSYAFREWIDLSKTSLPALLHSEDRMSMSESIEMRVPFLDYRLVELLAHVHPSEKFEGGRTKAIFREAIDGLVPKKIQYRRDKKGFNVPSHAWMTCALRKRITRLFESDLMLEEYGLVNTRSLRDLHSKFTAGRGHLNGRMFFRAYSLEVFLRRFAGSLCP